VKSNAEELYKQQNIAITSAMFLRRAAPALARRVVIRPAVQRSFATSVICRMRAPTARNCAAMSMRMQRLMIVQVTRVLKRAIRAQEKTISLSCLSTVREHRRDGVQAHNG
jgi:hypothetical protein